MRKYSSFILITFCIWASLLSGRAASDESPNILFIMIDDLNADISAVGGPIQTPHIDALASRGVMFTRMFVQQPVCSASRASILTGLRPDTTGVNYPYSAYFVEELQPKVGIISDFFHDNGYLVKQFGKVHHGIDNQYQHIYDKPQSGGFVSDSLNDRSKLEGRGQLPPYEKVREGEEGFNDHAIATDAIRALRTYDGEKPFCYVVGFHKPHLPFSAPKKYWSLYDRERIAQPVPVELASGAPSYAVDQYYLWQYRWETDDPSRAFSPLYAAKIKHAYYASASFVDTQVGRVLDALEEFSLAENTIVALISDHGFLLGEQNYWGKTNLFDKGVKVPFILSWPGTFDEGLKSDALVESVDVFPTLAALAGLEIPEYLEGTSFEPVLNEPNMSWKKGVYSQQPRGNVSEVEGVSLRTDRYRYTEWMAMPSGTVLERELYDYEVDPSESRNLVDDAEYALIADKLAEELRSGWKSKLPEGYSNNSNNSMAPPSYGWGNEGRSRRAAWHELFGGDESEGWRSATERRAKVEGVKYTSDFNK